MMWLEAGIYLMNFTHKFSDTKEKDQFKSPQYFLNIMIFKVLYEYRQDDNGHH